ncbi:MAG: S41 family peptidase [Telluria sp.]
MNQPIRRAVLALMLCAAGAVHAQVFPIPSRDDPDSAVDRNQNRAVVEALTRNLKDHYVFPELAAKLDQSFHRRLQHGDYDKITSARQLAETLSAQLQQESKDKHLAVFYYAKPLPEAEPNRGPAPEELAAERAEAQAFNYGVARVERLPFNIGYLDLRGFMHLRAGTGPALASAMTLVAHTDALIIDLRRNGGGEPETVAFLASYLLDERTHLNDAWYRDGERLEQAWSLSDVPGLRFGGGKPVYILTSHDTFSAAEDFSYAMKNLKRATIVGETTGGGAHPGDFMRLAPHFSVNMPNGKSISPVTKTDWEGTGVAPDVAVPTQDALRVAQTAFLSKLLETTKGPKAGRVQARIEELKTDPAAR